MIGGKIVVPLNPNENDHLVKLGEDYSDICQRDLEDGRTFWIGITSNTVPAVWVVGFISLLANYRVMMKVKTILGFIHTPDDKLHKLGCKCKAI